MGVCCIIGCKNRTKNIKEGISLHRIPINLKKRKKWMEILNGIHKNTEFICSAHFLPGCFTHKNKRKVLLEDAVPSIFLCCPQELLVKRLSVPRENLSNNSQYAKLFEDIPGPGIILEKNYESCALSSTSELDSTEVAFPSYSNKVKKLQEMKRRYDKKIAKVEVVLRNLKRKNLLISQQIFDLIDNYATVIEIN